MEGNKASGMHGVTKVKLNNMKRNSFKERNLKKDLCS